MRTRRHGQRYGTLRIASPPALPGQRIGLMGGSFNPPHAGHLAAARAALVRLRLDRVWWLVTPGNPLKSSAELMPLKARIEACRRLASDPRMVVTALEAGLTSAYTADTVDYLRSRYPGVRFVWIMGADGLAGFHRWERWRDIAGGMPIAVVDRPGWRMAALASPVGRALGPWRLRSEAASRLPFRAPPAWVLLTNRLFGQSSTALRHPR